MRDGVQLITYADRLAGSIPGLAEMLGTGPLAGLFTGVHVLPFFRPYDGADAGFDPADHREVDARLGTWADVAALGRRTETVVDLIVNHVSADSPWFRDVVAHGDASPYAGMFLTFDGLFPGGATEDDLLTIYRPRPGLPFTAMRLGGRKRLVWTTFTSQQIDLDLRDERARGYLTEVVDLLAEHGVTHGARRRRRVRGEDAGHVVLHDPADVRLHRGAVGAAARARGLEVLVEVHSYYRRQIEIARHVDRVYDFGLPPLVLHALHAGTPHRCCTGCPSARSTASRCSTPTTGSASSTSAPTPRGPGTGRPRTAPDCSTRPSSTPSWSRCTPPAAARAGARPGPPRATSTCTR